jgi:glycosyltransferase involved in cell wall biosynthesis
MRIVHVIDSGGLYGAETVLLTLASEQIRRGDVPVILSMGGVRAGEKALEVEAERRKIDCETLRMHDGLNFALARRVVAAAEAQGADIIHSHGYKGNILLGLLPRAERRTAVVTTLHGWTAQRTFSKLGLYRFLDQRVLPRLDGVVLVNDEMRHLPAVARLARPAVTIPNGVTPAQHEAAEDSLADALAALRSRCAVVFGVVGRLSPEKNVAGLIDALHALGPDTNIGVAVLGAGPEGHAIEQIVKGRGLESRVLLAGYIANARAALPLLDAVVIPSLTEGLPMILLESMSAGVPVIATRVGDISAVLADSGILVPPGDVAALSGAMSTMARELPRHRELAALAARRVMHDYGAPAMAERYARVYAAAMQARP